MHVSDIIVSGGSGFRCQRTGSVSSLLPYSGGDAQKGTRGPFAKYCESLEILCKFQLICSILFLLPAYQPVTIHLRHCGPVARKAHVGHSPYGESLVSIDQHAPLLSLTSYQPVTFIIATCSIHHRHCG